MTDEQIALARRAVACKGWRWIRGMNTTTDDTFIAFSDCDEAYWLAHPDDPCEVEPIAGLLPDLTDPATLGCLLALVREAWNDRRGYLHPCSGYGWLCSVNGEHVYGVTEVEALVVALESAP